VEKEELLLLGLLRIRYHDLGWFS